MARNHIVIFFDTLLMVVFKLGIVGTVCATVSGMVLTSVIPLCYFLFLEESRLRLIRTPIDLDGIWLSPITAEVLAFLTSLAFLIRGAKSYHYFPFR